MVDKQEEIPFKDELVSYSPKRREISVDLWYPRNDHNMSKIRVGLVDVRAADDILIEYDFDWDGWIIKQASIFEWENNDPICDEGWTEVTFVQAWALEKNP